MISNLSVQKKQQIDSRPRKEIYKAISLLVAFIVLFIIVKLPNPGAGSELTVGGQRTIGVLVWTLIICISGALPDAIIGIGIISLLTIMNVGPLSDTLGGMATQESVLIIGGYLLAAAMNKTCLDQRIALKIMSVIGTNVKSLIIGLMVINIVLCPFIPATAVKGALMLPIVIGIITALGFEAGEKKRSKKELIPMALLLTGVSFGPNIAANSMLTGITTNVITNRFIQDAGFQPLTWGQWFLANWPLTIVYFIFLYILLVKICGFKKDNNLDVTKGKEYVKDQLQKLGKVKKEEIIVLVMMVLAVIFFLTQNIHKVPNGIVMFAITGLFWIPGIKILTWKEAETKVAWGIWLLMVAGMTLGNLLFKTSAALWISKATLVSFGIQNLPVIIGLILLMWFLHILHLGVSSAMAMASLIVPIFISFAQVVGWNPTVMGLIAVISTNMGMILPISTITALQAYGTDYYSQLDQMKVGIPLTLVFDVILVLLVLFYYPLLGLKL
jgi:Di- and tricarboxylate transporters